MLTIGMVSQGEGVLYEPGSLESLALGSYGRGYYHFGLLQLADAKRATHTHADPQRTDQVLRAVRTA